MLTHKVDVRQIDTVATLKAVLTLFGGTMAKMWLLPDTNNKTDILPTECTHELTLLCRTGKVIFFCSFL